MIEIRKQLFIPILFLILVLSSSNINHIKKLKPKSHIQIQYTKCPAVSQIKEMIAPKVEPVAQAPQWYYPLTPDEEIDVAAICYLESGSSIEGMSCVAEIVLNRVQNGKFGHSISDVIFAKNQFSTAKKIGSIEPPQSAYEAVEKVFKWGEITMKEKPLYFCDEDIKRRFQYENRVVLGKCIGLYGDNYYFEGR